MQHVHREYLDPSLAPYGARYVSYLRALHRSGVRWYNTTRTTGYCTALLRIDGDHLHVKLLPTGEGFFEFATSGWPLATHDNTQEGFTHTGYFGMIVGVRAKIIGGSLNFAATVRGQARSANDGATESMIGRQFQVDLLNEPVAYPQAVNVGTELAPRWTYPNALFESWAPQHPHTGVLLRSTELAAGIPERYYSGPSAQWAQRDVMFDVPFELSKNRAATKRAYIRDGGDADWPRACGVQVVTHNTYGTREFAIYVDAYSQFYIFPTGSIAAQSGINQNVPGTDVQVASPTFPGWAYTPSSKFKDYFGGGIDAPTAAHATVDLPEIDWKCNHDGTKAVAIVYTRSAYTYDSGFWEDADANPSEPMTSTIFDEFRDHCGVGSRMDLTFDTGHSDTRYMCAPGILKLAIEITLTGAGAADFSVNITTTTVRDPTSHTRCPILVGFAWYDCPGVATKGDMVALDIEAWSIRKGSLSAWSAGSTGGHGNNMHMTSLRNLDTDTEIKTFNGYWPLVAFDMPTLSFVFRAFPLIDAGIDGHLADMFAMVIYIGGVYKEALFPTEIPFTDASKAGIVADATVDYRARIDSYIAADATWERVPLNISPDGFSVTDMTAYREHFARRRNKYGFYQGVSGDARFWHTGLVTNDCYKLITLDGVGVPNWPDVNTDINGVEEDMLGRWATYPQIATGVTHLLFCTDPKFTWNKYQSYIADVLYTCAGTTFYVHPNGSYAFWDNASLWNGNGFNRDLASFDSTKVKHVIFDRIKMVVPSKTGTLVTGYTTFFALYNQAVQSGIDAGTLAAGIEVMTPESLRATFATGVITNSTGTPSTAFLLDLRATWDGTNYYFPEPGITDYYLPTTPVVHGLLGLDFNWSWRVDGSGYSDTVIPAASQKHVRFANPLLIGA